MPGRHPTFKNHRKVKKFFREEVWDVLCCEGGPPWGLMGVKIFLSKIFWDLDDGGHNEGVGAGSCHSGGEAQKRNDGKFPPPKAKGKTRDKVAAYEGVSGRTLGKAMAAGGKFGLVQGISMYTEGGHCLVPPRSQNRRLFLTRDSPLPGPCGEHLLPHRPLTLGCPLCVAVAGL